MSVRSEFAAVLATDWADIPELADVRVIATERELDDIQVTTALIRMKGIARTTGAPMSHRDYSVTLTVISPHLDLDLAGDELDVLAEAVLDYLSTRFQSEPAQVVGYLDRLALDIPVTITAQKEA